MSKILHIITGLNQGGAESILVKLLENYENKDSFYVVSLTGKGYYSDRIEKISQVYHLEFNKPRRILADFVKLIKLLKTIKPDVVQTWMYHADLIGGLLAKCFTKSRIFWNIRNGNIDPQFISRSTWLVVKLCAWLSRTVPDVIVSCSQIAANTHIKFGYDAKKVIIINNGVLTDQLHIDRTFKREVLEKLGIPADAIVLGNVSRWHPLKDHATLIKAFNLVTTTLPNQNIYLLLIGKGLDEQNQELADILARENTPKKVRLLGPTNDINWAFNLLDIHVLSSVGEAFPNVVAEAMACGVQCVVTDVGEASFILGDERFVAPARDPQKLATCLVEAINYIAKTPENSIKNRDRIMQNFSIQKMCEAYHHFWHKKAEVQESIL